LLIEDSPTQPLSLYAATKLEAEALLLPAGAVIFRLGTLFGLGDTYSRIRLDLVLNSLTVKACRHGRIRVFGGEQHRPLLHVKDVAEAVVAALDADCSGVFNLHASNLRIVELARLVQAQVPGAEVHTTPIRLEDARNYRVSSDKARAAFGFEPRRAPEQGIDEIRRLVVEGRIRDLASPRFSNTDHLRPMLVADSTDLGAEVSPGLEGHRRW
jgi:nucleoside-diphosphate-sugar epimerase